jgi:hypothetical protein
MSRVNSGVVALLLAGFASVADAQTPARPSGPPTALPEAKGEVRGSVLDETGASKGALYHYFDSKQSLIGAVVERMAGEVVILPLIRDSSTSYIVVRIREGSRAKHRRR